MAHSRTGRTPTAHPAQQVHILRLTAETQRDKIDTEFRAERDVVLVREAERAHDLDATEESLARVLDGQRIVLRRHLGIADDDDRYCHVFDFGSQKPRRYSDNALREMKDALDTGVDMDEVWRLHGRRRRSTREGA